MVGFGLMLIFFPLCSVCSQRVCESRSERCIPRPGNQCPHPSLLVSGGHCLEWMTRGLVSAACMQVWVEWLHLDSALFRVIVPTNVPACRAILDPLIPTFIRSRLTHYHLKLTVLPPKGAKGKSVKPSGFTIHYVVGYFCERFHKIHQASSNYKTFFLTKISLMTMCSAYSTLNPTLKTLDAQKLILRA